MAIAQNYPALKPSLSLDFANVKALDPRITFSRATTATYYGTETAKAEENLVLYSQEFNDSYWLKARIEVTANDTTAPDGTTTAEKLTQASGQTTAGVVFHTLYSTINGLTYTYSVFAKAGTGRNFILLEDTFVGAASSQTWFNLSTGAVATSSANHTASIVNAGNGWFRCIISVTAVTSSSTRSVLFRVPETDNSVVVTDDQGFIFIWGAQLEQRDSVTAYTPTTTQPITNFIPVLESAASGVARFDHNPVTKESLGLLIEEQRTNLLLRSEEFDNAVWTKTNLTIDVNQKIAPDGTLSSDLLTFTALGQNRLVSNFAFSAGVTQTLSAYFKDSNTNIVSVGLRLDSSFPRAAFNLATQSIDMTGAGTIITGSSITSVGNGWFRCSATFNAPTLGSTNHLVFTGGNGFSGVPGDNFYIWGAQLEVGAFPTSYIPTVASQVTRAADSASMTGANFSSWYNAAEGTLYSETKRPLGSRGSFTVDDGTDNNRILLSNNIINTNTALITLAGVSQANFIIGTNSQLFDKSSMAYKFNDIAGVQNNGAVGTDTSANIPTVNFMRLGIAGAGPGSCHYKKIAYFNRRLANAELQAITS